MRAQLTSKPRELPVVEPTQGVCAFIVDCGQHEETELGTGKLSLKPKVMYIFEMDQKRSDGLPFIQAQTFTNSLHEKANQRKFLESWEGKKFTDAQVKEGIDLDIYLGKNGIFNLVENKGYVNIASVSKLRAKDAPMKATIQELPKWVYNYIAKAKVPPAGFVAPEAGESKDGLPF